jgi:hypothetical protein
MIFGRISCWEQFYIDRDAVNDPQNTVDVLVNRVAMWGSRRFFGAEASARGFNGKLKLPSLTAEHSEVLKMA